MSSNFFDLIVKMRDVFIISGKLTLSEVEGFSEEEVNAMQFAVGCQFPLSYKVFLMVMGHRFGKISRTEGMFLENIQSFIELQSFPAELSEENQCVIEIPHNSLIISQHDGYQFVYLIIGSDDPPVFLYVEGMEHSKMISSSFSSYLTDLLKQYNR